MSLSAHPYAPAMLSCCKSSAIQRVAGRICAALGMVAMIVAASTSTPNAAAANDTAPPAATMTKDESVLIGVGLVIGLPDTGDAVVDDMFIDGSIVGVLRRAGLDLWRGQIRPRRIAKVLVTAELPAEPVDGKWVAVSVTAIGDATSLAGGILLATPLRDEDGKVYAVGQGQVEVGNQVAGAELWEQPGIAARIGRLADGAVLGTDQPSSIAFD